LHGENAELKDEVTELARRYNIVTPYTAYLIVEDEARRGVAANARTFQVDDQNRGELALHFNSFNRDKAGELAVGGARFSSSLKLAQTASDAITLSREESLKSQAKAAPALTAPAIRNRLGVGISGVAPLSAPAAAEVAKDRSDAYAQQSKFINGRTFFQNGSQWVDSEVQNAANAKPVRVQFGSKEYFDLQKKHPHTQAWLAAGRNVQFVLAGTVYEIYE